jgi:hypothetical protein
MTDHLHSNCDGLLQSLSDYLDGELSEEMCREILEHLETCGNCRGAKYNARTIDLVRLEPECACPPSAEVRLLVQAADLDTLMIGRQGPKCARPRKKTTSATLNSRLRKSCLSWHGVAGAVSCFRRTGRLSAACGSPSGPACPVAETQGHNSESLFLAGAGPATAGLKLIRPDSASPSNSPAQSLAPVFMHRHRCSSPGRG